MKQKIENCKSANPTWGYKNIAKHVGCSPNLVRYYLDSNMKNVISKRSIDWKTRVTKAAKRELGGCCSRCGYNRCLSALDFHHLEPADKNPKFGCMRHLLSGLGKAAFLAEVKKCILICSNCHREEHNPE